MEEVTININGQFVQKTSKNAGAAGSSNTCSLRFVFDESWDGFAKRVIWRDSKGENRTSVILVPEVAENTSEYVSYVPQIVTASAGWCSFTIEGYYQSSPEKIMKSACDALFVSYSDVSTEIIPPGVSEIMQLQSEFEQLMPQVNTLINDTKSSVERTCQNLSVWEMYNSESIYSVGNKVAWDGRCYVCIKEPCITSPANTKYWLMIADRGERGAKGNPGPQGICGESGPKGDKGDRGDKGEKGDKGDKGERGERGISGGNVPANGYYTFSVDENGDLWLHYPDDAKSPEAVINESGELILTVEGADPFEFNVGKVKGDAFTYEDFTQEQKEELLTLAIPEIEEVNEAAQAAQSAAAEAADSEDVAVQAMEDLLEMINSGDIVLATNGKLPLSAIPATATMEIYTVSSEDKLTSLTAQRGDLAELIEELNGEQTITKTWQCLGDSTVRDNWVVWGTSYAVQAGNAATADNASNANMINNHRIVEMTEEEFSAAVKDEDTYYLVY